MARLTFPSIENPTRRYTWNKSAFDSSWRYDWRGAAPLHDCAGYFETLGDGEVQHSPECPAPVSATLDYLASLAAYLDEHNDCDTLETLANDWPKPHYGISTQGVKFAAELRHKDGKTVYYSTEHRKTSTSDSKRHDKRWEELGDWADGSLAAIVRLCLSPHSRGLDRYASIEAIARIMDTIGADARHSTYTDRAELCGFIPRRADGEWHSEHNNTANDIHAAFNAVNHYVLSERERDYARRCFSCLKNNYIDRQVKTATEAA